MQKFNNFLRVLQQFASSWTITSQNKHMLYNYDIQQLRHYDIDNISVYSTRNRTYRN